MYIWCQYMSEWIMVNSKSIGHITKKYRDLVEWFNRTMSIHWLSSSNGNIDKEKEEITREAEKKHCVCWCHPKEIYLMIVENRENCDFHFKRIFQRILFRCCCYCCFFFFFFLLKANAKRIDKYYIFSHSETIYLFGHTHMVLDVCVFFPFQRSFLFYYSLFLPIFSCCAFLIDY